jgi:hypothetical protein
VEDLGLLLLPSGRPGRRLIGAEEDAAVEITLALFLLPRGRPRPRFSTTTPTSKSTTPVLTMEILQWISEQERRNPNQFREEDNVVAKIKQWQARVSRTMENPILISHL